MNAFSPAKLPWPRFSEDFSKCQDYKMGVLGIPRKYLKAAIDRDDVWSCDELELANEFRGMVDVPRPPQALVVLGVNHCGKTHLACGLVDFLDRCDDSVKTVKLADGEERLVQTNFRPRYVDESDLLQRIAGYGRGYDWFSEYTDVCRFLVMDEFGSNKWSETESRRMMQLLNKRFNNGGQTVILTNRSLPELFELLSDNVRSRLRGCRTVQMTQVVDEYAGQEADDEEWLR